MFKPDRPPNKIILSGWFLSHNTDDIEKGIYFSVAFKANVIDLAPESVRNFKSLKY